MPLLTEMLELLPSLQFGEPFSELPSGDHVYITPNGKLVCRHGECSSTICHFLSEEGKALKNGLPPPARGGSRGKSVCDCTSTEGLNVKPSNTVKLPEAPSSLFEFLQEMTGAESIKVKGKEARRVPHLPGPTFLTIDGRFCCRHGASLKSLRKREKITRPSNRLPTCGCALKPVPWRTGLKGLQLGKQCSCVLNTLKCN